MIDYERVHVRRLPDRASPSHVTWRDRLRALWVLRNPRVAAGRAVIIREGVKISICETGRLEIGDHCLLHSYTWFLLTMPKPRVSLGRWVFIGRDTIVAAKNRITIGDFTIIAPRCFFVDHEHGFAAGEIIHNQMSQLKEIAIGRDCYFGTGTVVLGGVNIGDGAVIGAGSVVTEDVPPLQVWAGNPARYVKDRT